MKRLYKNIREHAKAKFHELYGEGDLLTEDMVKADMSQAFLLPFSQKG